MAMTLTVADVVKDAMGLIGAVEIDETPSASEMNIALRALNVMIDSWSSQHLMLQASTSVEFILIEGKAKYTTLDTGGPKIIRVNSGYVTDDGGCDDNLEVQTKEFYDSIQDKNLTYGVPQYICFSPGSTQQAVPSDDLYLYYTPDKAYLCHLECDIYLTEFTKLTDIVTFAPAYYEALIYNLATRLFRRYSDDKTPVPQDIAMIAHNAISTLKNMNSQPVICGFDFVGMRTKNNIYTDGD